jgi:hypothetical protein
LEIDWRLKRVSAVIRRFPDRSVEPNPQAQTTAWSSTRTSEAPGTWFSARSLGTSCFKLSMTEA